MTVQHVVIGRDARIVYRDDKDGDELDEALQSCPRPSRTDLDRRPGYHGPAMGTEAVRFLVLWMAGWVNSRQREVIDFLREENRVLHAQLGGRRLRFSEMRRMEDLADTLEALIAAVESRGSA